MGADRFVIEFRPRDAAAAVQPSAEIDEFAASRAKGPIRAALRPFDGAFARWTEYGRRILRHKTLRAGSYDTALEAEFHVPGYGLRTILKRCLFQKADGTEMPIAADLGEARVLVAQYDT